MENTSNLPAVIQAALKAQNIDPTKCNLMLPTQTYGDVIGMFNRISFESIRVNPDLAGKEVYEPDGPGKGKALAKVPLQRISFALGIKWDPATTGIQEDTEFKSRAKATGAMQKPNGDWVVITEEKTINVTALVRRERMHAEDRAEKGDPDQIDHWEKTPKGKSYPIFKPWKSEAAKKAWIDRSVEATEIRYQNTKDELANTGAKERVIRAFIAMKSTYTDEELEKDFVYPCVSLDSAKMLATPELQEAAIKRADGSITAIFGRSSNRGIIDVSPQKQIPRTVDVETQEVIEPVAEEGQLGMFPEVEPEKAAEPELSPEDKLKKILAGYKEKIPADLIGNARTGKTVHQLIDAVISNSKATAENINAAIDWCTNLLQKQQEGGAS